MARPNLSARTGLPHSALGILGMSSLLQFRIQEVIRTSGKLDNFGEEKNDEMRDAAARFSSLKYSGQMTQSIKRVGVVVEDSAGSGFRSGLKIRPELAQRLSIVLHRILDVG